MKIFRCILPNSFIASGCVRSHSPQNRSRLVADALHRREEGGALLELALMLPVLAFLSVGVLMFGLAINNYLQLVDAVSVTAKHLAVSRTTSGEDPCAQSYSDVFNAAPGLYTGSASPTISVVLNGVSAGSSSASSFSCSAASSNLISGSTATVTVTYPCSLYTTSSCTLSAYTSEMIQ